MRAYRSRARETRSRRINIIIVDADNPGGDGERGGGREQGGNPPRRRIRDGDLWGERGERSIPL